MNLEHHGIMTEKKGEGNVRAAGNDAKFLTSSWSSAHIPFNDGLGQFNHRQNKEDRGEGELGKK
jgi:hypothetical protein